MLDNRNKGTNAPRDVVAETDPQPDISKKRWVLALLLNSLGLVPPLLGSGFLLIRRTPIGLACMAGSGSAATSAFLLVSIDVVTGFWRFPGPLTFLAFFLAGAIGVAWLATIAATIKMGFFPASPSTSLDRGGSPARGRGAPRVAGAVDALDQTPDRGDKRWQAAWALNALGFIPPFFGLGFFVVGQRKFGWIGLGTGVVLILVGLAASAMDLRGFDTGSWLTRVTPALLGFAIVIWTLGLAGLAYFWERATPAARRG